MINLKPVGGSAYTHVFENRQTGLARGLYWSVTIDCEPIVIDNESWDTSLTCEWLTWPIRTWRELDGMTLDRALQPALVEASLYLAAHQVGQCTKLAFKHRSQATFDSTIDMIVDVDLPNGGTAPSMLLSVSAPVVFDGVYVVPDNLSPPAESPALAIAALEEFLDSSDFLPPRWDRFKYVFSPARDGE